MSPLSHITEAALVKLREDIRPYMGARRYAHTLSVAEEAVCLANIYLPKNIAEIQAAALLHDVTKEWSFAEQIDYCRTHGISLTAEEYASPKVIHAITAPTFIKENFPTFAEARILSAIRTHTVGGPRMPLFSKILYLADYIEKTRTFPDCVALRRMFWELELPRTKRAQIRHLDRVILASYDMTIRSLLEEGAPISSATLRARNELLSKNLSL